MRKVKGVSIVIGLILLFQFAAPYASAAVTKAWEFESQEGPYGWETVGDASADVRNGNLVFAARGRAAVVSPAFGAASPKGVVWIRLKAEKDCYGAVSALLSSGRKALSKGYWIQGARGYMDFRFLAAGGKDESIERLSLEFSPGARVSMDFVRFYEPAAMESLRLRLATFWEFDPAVTGLINSAALPSPANKYLMASLYAVMAIVFMSAAMLYMFKGRGLTRGMLAKAGALAFAASSLILAARMDYNWARALPLDAARFSGKEDHELMAEALRFNMEDSRRLFGFIRFLKGALPKDVVTRPAVKYDEDYVSMLVDYHLLPIRSSADADYLWVYNGDAVFDPADNTLISAGKVVAGPVALVARYDANGVLYRTTPQRRGHGF
ncbi:MAG: hypothetical protein HY880_08660 [Deltaproteobacteria bacterium]|nr:hypothetical protein [Deltaproteobacteria bacterium]